MTSGSRISSTIRTACTSKSQSCRSNRERLAKPNVAGPLARCPRAGSFLFGRFGNQFSFPRIAADHVIAIKPTPQVDQATSLRAKGELRGHGTGFFDRAAAYPALQS